MAPALAPPFATSVRLHVRLGSDREEPRSHAQVGEPPESGHARNKAFRRTLTQSGPHGGPSGERADGGGRSSVRAPECCEVWHTGPMPDLIR